MKKNNLIYMLMALAFIFTSCDEPGSERLWSLTHLQLDAATGSTGTRSYTYERVNDGVNIQSGFEVLLASAPLDQAVNVTFEIVPSTAADAAIENVHFVVNSTTVTIPAGQNIVTLPIDIIDEGINPGEIWAIDVRLVSADVEIAEEFAQAVHNVQITCPSAIEGTYDTVASGNRGGGGGTVAGTYGPISSTVTLATTGAGGTYEISDASFGMYAQVYGDGIPVDGRVVDICDAISGDGIADRFDDPFTLTGTRDPGTGVITITWSNTWGDSGTVTMTPQ